MPEDTLTPAFPTFDQKMMERWDREWLTYLSTESMYPHLVSHHELVRIAELDGLDAKTLFSTVFTHNPKSPYDSALAIWCPADHLIGKSVVEIGCGCGFLGKQLGLVVERYLGLDYSELALTIARGASPSNCTYLMPSDAARLTPLAGSFDTLVAREFFIHQNLEQARIVLRTARHLLRPGGVVCADFYHTNPDIPQGVVHPANSPLDPVYASAGYHYERKDIEALATEFGLTVESQEADPAYQRLFTILRVSG